MDTIFLDLLPAYYPFEISISKSSGEKYDPSGTPTVRIYEEGGIDGVFDSTEIAGSPFTITKINEKTGNYGVLIAKSLLTTGKIYRALFEITVDAKNASLEKTYFACNAAQFKQAFVSGGTVKNYTITDSISGLPITDVFVWVTSDVGGINVLQSGYTNVSGQIQFTLENATYYVWSRKYGYNFTNPDIEIMPSGDWACTGKAASSSEAAGKTFGDLCKAVLRHIKEIGVPEIQEIYNEFLREHDLDRTKQVKRTITVTATDNFLLNYDLITVHEVYLNDEKIAWMDYKEYLEGTYTTSGYYTIFDGRIYFPADLALTDTLYIIASVAFTEQDDFEKTDVLDVPNYWFNVAVNYICKELYADPDNYDANQIARYEHKYQMGYADAISQKLDVEGFKLDIFDDLDLSYDWE